MMNRYFLGGEFRISPETLLIGGFGERSWLHECSLERVGFKRSSEIDKALVLY